MVKSLCLFSFLLISSFAHSRYIRCLISPLPHTLNSESLCLIPPFYINAMHRYFISSSISFIIPFPFLVIRHREWCIFSLSFFFLTKLVGPSTAHTPQRRLCLDVK
ncbi:hypothetical protein F4775DRAFT_335342 [Biscogniauxia sp. FL1348]|nr:hypothetical protein F4775DRAFT_335342 [Biscogniauxia sp. FL1348]